MLDPWILWIEGLARGARFRGGGQLQGGVECRYGLNPDFNDPIEILRAAHGLRDLPQETIIVAFVTADRIGPHGFPSHFGTPPKREIGEESK